MRRWGEGEKLYIEKLRRAIPSSILYSYADALGVVMKINY